jgi:hypothetical protein
MKRYRCCRGQPGRQNGHGPSALARHRCTYERSVCRMARGFATGVRRQSNWLILEPDEPVVERGDRRSDIPLASGQEGCAPGGAGDWECGP